MSEAGIDLGYFDVGMAKPFHDLIEADDLLSEAGGEGVAELVPTHAIMLHLSV